MEGNISHWKSEKPEEFMCCLKGDLNTAYSLQRENKRENHAPNKKRLLGED